MKIKQSMKKLGIVSLSTVIIPLIMVPTANVYAKEESKTESSTEETQQSTQQLKDPLSILSRLDSGAKSTSTEETQESDTQTSSEEDVKSVKGDSDDKSEIENEKASGKETISTEEGTNPSSELNEEEIAKSTLRARASARAVVSGNWTYDVYVDGYYSYAWLRTYIGPATTALIIPTMVDGMTVIMGSDFFNSLSSTIITDIAIQPVGASNKCNVMDLSFAFNGNTKIVNVDLSNSIYSGLSGQSNRGAFNGCSNLQYVRLPQDILNNVTDTGYMFANCAKLNNLVFDANFKTQNVTNMEYMFLNCSSLTSLDLSKFNTTKVISMASMFEGCSKLVGLDLSTFKTDNVTNMASMFENCTGITNINAANWVTGKVTTMHKMFANCQKLPQLYISHFDTTQVNDLSGIFLNNYSLNSSTFSFTTGTQNVVNMADMYNGCKSLTSLDVTHLNTQKVLNMYGMFANCPNLVTLKVNGANFNTQNVTDMSFMFAGDTALTSLDVSHFNTGKVQNMAYMFASNQNLTTLNVTNFNTGSVTNMSGMFLGTEKIKSLDLTSFNTHIVSNMTDMFKTGSQKELFVLSNDAKILNHGYHLDNRVPPEILLQANYGQFSDTSTSKNYFTRCALTPAEATVSQVQNFMSNNTPTRTNRTFEGWSLVSGNDVNAVSAFTQLFGTTYKAKWNSFGLAQVPSTKSFNGNLSKGTVTIPSSGTTNEVGVLDETSDTKGWTLTAQLVWSGTAPNSATTLRTTSSGTSDEISPTGSISTAPAGLITTGGNLSISTTPGIVMIGNDGVQQFEGTYVTDLGSISLEIADGSEVVAQGYSGNIQWDLAIAP